MLQTMLRKERNGSQIVEFATISENAFTVLQIERKDTLVYMRAKKRAYVWT